MARGPRPRPDFSTAAYLAAHPYLARAGINPFLHALARRAGSLAGAATATLPPPDTDHALRLARRLVDGPFYRAGNPDLQAAGVDPADHYMASGWREGREPAPQFDTLAYCLTHAITYATQNPLVHYVLNGGPARPDRDAGLALRVATLAPYFDAAHYRAGLNEARADALAEASDAELLRSYVEAAGGRSSARGRTSTRRASCRRGPAAGRSGTTRSSATWPRRGSVGVSRSRRPGGWPCRRWTRTGTGRPTRMWAHRRRTCTLPVRAGGSCAIRARVARPSTRCCGCAGCGRAGRRWRTRAGSGRSGGGLRIGLTTGRSGWTVRRG